MFTEHWPNLYLRYTFTSTEHLTVAILTPVGVSASPSSLTFTSCGTDQTVTFTAAGNAVNGSATASITENTSLGTFMNQVDIPITITQPVVRNIKPSVAVSGFINGALYELGVAALPTAMCVVTDDHDTVVPFPADLSGTLTHGLGDQTATCNYTDTGQLAAITATAKYTIRDTIDPTISHLLSGGTLNSNDWYKADVTVTFTCSDVPGSGIQSCLGDTTLGEGEYQSVTGTATDWAGHTATDTASGINIDKTPPVITFASRTPANTYGWNNTDVTLTWNCTDLGGSGTVTSTVSQTRTAEGAGQSASGTCEDLAGNTASDTRGGINIDKAAPSVSLVGGPVDGTSYYFGYVPAAPTCTASDDLSHLVGTCVVTGGGTTVGPQYYTATATDKAGNQATDTHHYSVLAWTLNGFYQPVDMGGVLVWNTVKGGSTVPLKFQLFAGPTELTSTSAVKSFTQSTIACPGASATLDPIDIVTTGGTSLRYDTTGGQFIQNWQTPKKPGACYVTTMTAQDGSTISANFMLK